VNEYQSSKSSEIKLCQFQSPRKFYPDGKLSHCVMGKKKMIMHNLISGHFLFPHHSSVKLGKFLTLPVIRVIYTGKVKRLSGGAGGFFPSIQQPSRFQVIASQRNKTAGSRRRSGCVYGHQGTASTLAPLIEIRGGKHFW
jgi:hypothetical protein